MLSCPPQPDASVLRALLGAARERTLAYAATLQQHQWLGPYLNIVNPPLWELGHLAWFQEHWCLRHDGVGPLAPTLLQGADALYNSAVVPHAQRWQLPLPAPQQTLHYLETVLTALYARIAREGATAWLRYFVQLAVFHEEMHNEAFAYSHQTLCYPYKKTEQNHIVTTDAVSGDVDVAGARFRLGAEADSSFVFDNEKWAHEVEVAPYRMARTAVSNAEFAVFVEEDGYARRALWCEEGWHWRTRAAATAPLYWQRQGAQWRVRQGQQWLPLDTHAAVVHVNWFEADAYCRWAQRRLPTEAEWEFAAATAPGDTASKRRYPWGDVSPTARHANLYGVASGTADVSAFAAGDSAWGIRQMLGNVWEWTADWFSAYPGFVRDPYQEYSEPWFGNHKVLRGGCHATRASLLRNTWRNFYTPDRRDVFAGFRTCALEGNDDFQSRATAAFPGRHQNGIT